MSIRVVAVVAVVLLAACAAPESPVPAASTPSLPSAPPTTVSTSVSTTVSTTGPTTGPIDEVRPAGFATITGTVTSAPGEEPCELCLWLADEPDLRRRGLMGVTALEPAVGMAFVHDEPRTTSFTMRNTLVPLSIAFYDAAGAYLDAFDMEPCVAEPCPSYPTPADFTVAVEVPQGRLTELGMVPGSRLDLTGPECDTPPSH